jgi:hypothetical protein
MVRMLQVLRKRKILTKMVRILQVLGKRKRKTVRILQILSNAEIVSIIQVLSKERWI